MSVSIAKKSYQIRLTSDLVIELQNVPEDSTVPSPNITCSALKILLALKTKPLGIEFIQQQNTDILKSANASNFIYLWIGFEHAIDLVCFDLSKSKQQSLTTNVSSTGFSVLSFTYDQKLVGQLSQIQILDTIFGTSTLVGLHFIYKKRNETTVTIFPLDSYVALYYAEKYLKLSVPPNTYSIHLNSQYTLTIENIDLSKVKFLEMVLNDTSETRSLIDCRTLRPWCPFMHFHPHSTDPINTAVNETITCQEKLSTSSFSFAAIAQTRKQVQKVMSYVPVQQKFLDAIHTLTNSNNNCVNVDIFNNVSNIKVPCFNNSNIKDELVVIDTSITKNEYYEDCRRKSINNNNEFFLWQYCIALQIIPISRLQHLFKTYFPAFYQQNNVTLSFKDILNDENLRNVDISFYRTLLFEALVVSDQSYYISEYIQYQNTGDTNVHSSMLSSSVGPVKSTLSSSLSLLSQLNLSANGSGTRAVSSHNMTTGHGSYILEDVGRVHTWAVEYKIYLDENVRNLNQQVYGPLLLYKAVSEDYLLSQSGDVIDMPMIPFSQLCMYQTMNNAVINILKSLRDRKIQSFIPMGTSYLKTKNTGSALKDITSVSNMQQQMENDDVFEKDFLYEEHKNFVTEISSVIGQLNVLASLMNFFSIACYSATVASLISFKPFQIENISKHNNSMYSMYKHNQDKYTSLQDKAYVYVTPDMLKMKWSVFDFLVHRLCHRLSMSCLNDSESNDDTKNASAIYKRYLNLFQTPFLCQKHQQQATKNVEETMSVDDIPNITQEANISSFLLLPYEIAINSAPALLSNAPILPVSTDSLKAKWNLDSNNHTVLKIIDQFFGNMSSNSSGDKSWPYLNHEAINNNDLYINVHMIHLAHQLILYTLLDSTYIMLETSFMQQEDEIISKLSMSGEQTLKNRTLSMPHTDNDDDFDSFPSHEVDNDEVLTLYRYNKIRLVRELNNVTNIMATALQLNIIQKNFIFALWKIDNNIDILEASDELCRAIHHLDQDSDLFEVVIQRLLSVNTDNCLKAVDRLVHYFVNNDESVGMMLKYGCRSPTSINFNAVPVSESQSSTTQSSDKQSRVGFSVLALAASHLHEFGFINGWHMSRRLCTENCKYSSYEKIQVRKQVALMMVKWCALTGHLKEFLELDLDEYEASQVEEYLEDLAQKDITAAKVSSSFVQFFCTWLIRRKKYGSARKIHELYKESITNAFEKMNGSYDTTGIDNIQHILDAYTLVPTISEEYFRDAYPRSQIHHPSLYDTSSALDTYQPQLVNNPMYHSLSPENSSGSDQLPRLEPWFAPAFNYTLPIHEHKSTQKLEVDDNIMKSSRKI